MGLILSAANGGGVTRTKLMHRAYLAQLSGGNVRGNGLMEYENIKSIDQQRKRLLQIHDKMEELAPLSFAERHSKQDNRLPLDRIRGLAAEKYLRIVMALSE